jgi:hypothetical protein
MNQPDTIRKNINKFVVLYASNEGNCENDNYHPSWYTCRICKFNNYWTDQKRDCHRYTVVVSDSISSYSYREDYDLCDKCNEKFLAKKDTFIQDKLMRQYKATLRKFKKRLGGR